jgi:hypothetical protein
VPLTVMRLTGAHKAAVVELGMNHPGEIARLAAIAAPTVALVNNAQREHQEFMHTVEAVARENGAVLQALPADGVAVFPGDDEYTALWRGLAGERGVLTFGLSDACDVRAAYTPNGVRQRAQSHVVPAQARGAADAHDGFPPSVHHQTERRRRTQRPQRPGRLRLRAGRRHSQSTPSCAAWKPSRPSAAACSASRP